MRLALLTDETEDLFWDTVKRDYFDYYFFIYDWLIQRDKTEISLALERDTIVGLMLIYDESIVQLRGEPAAVRFLLDNLVSKVVDVQAPENCESVIVERFPNFALKEKILLMCISKGNEHLSINVKPEVLSNADSVAIASLMNECYPEMWSEITSAYVKRFMSCENAVWLGIRQQGRLVSFGYATIAPNVSHVTWVATHQHWRNKGYATSIVAALLEACLKKAPSAIIYVMERNLAAKTVYLKVGFKAQRLYILLKDVKKKS